MTANALKAGLDVKLSASLATFPDSTNPVDFRAAASQYTVGLAFNSPLNRLAERNVYRASLIAYQQARRSFMALDDQIQAAVRNDIRRSNATGEFQHCPPKADRRGTTGGRGRDRLLVLANAADTTGTQNVLNALSALLQAKSTLISSWIAYQSDRTQLLLDMDALKLDPRGLSDDQPGDRSSPARLGTPIVVPGGVPTHTSPRQSAKLANLCHTPRAANSERFHRVACFQVPAPCWSSWQPGAGAGFSADPRRRRDHGTCRSYRLADHCHRARPIGKRRP